MRRQLHAPHGDRLDLGDDESAECFSGLRTQGSKIDQDDFSGTEAIFQIHGTLSDDLVVESAIVEQALQLGVYRSLGLPVDPMVHKLLLKEFPVRCKWTQLSGGQEFLRRVSAHEILQIGDRTGPESKQGGDTWIQ